LALESEIKVRGYEEPGEHGKIEQQVGAAPDVQKRRDLGRQSWEDS